MFRNGKGSFWWRYPYGEAVLKIVKIAALLSGNEERDQFIITNVDARVVATPLA